MAKKSFTSDHPKQLITSISHAHPRIVGVVENISLDEDDDICPVCESECTCRNRTITAPPTTLLTPTTTTTALTSLSTPSSSNITPATQTPHTHPLKIKLTLPPQFKSRRLLPEPTGPIAPQQIPPRRRGRPSKAAIAAREVALRAQVAGNGYSESASASSSRRQKGKAPARPKKPKLAGTFVSNHASSSRMVVPPAPTDDSDLDDDVDTSSFPTFISASSLDHSSSSESDSSITSIDSDGVVESDEEDDERPLARSLRHNKMRTKKEPLGGENQKRPHTNNWEIKSRMRSEGPEDTVMEVDSDGHSSSDDGGADDEDEEGDGDEDEDEDEEDAEVVAEADVENEGLLASVGEPDEIDEDELPVDGKLGVSFGGVPTGWSEEDEESSFDADLFFANLEEDSSDSDSSPHVLHEAVDSDPLSADEQDALILMDVDATTHIRRSSSELEFGVSLSFGGWEGVLSRTDPASLDVDLGGVTTEDDIDMTATSDAETTEDDTTTILEDPGIILSETDGETTEDELVDADGLPNSRAMMLFQWPSTVPATNQAINPMSTMSMSSSTSSSHSGVNLTPPLDASPSVRIALASFSAAQRGSSPPTPADILAGRISTASDLEEHLHNPHGHSPDFSFSPMMMRTPTKRGAGRLCMGKFTTASEKEGKFAVVDGSGMDTPTPFPRLRLLRSREIERAMSKDSRSESDANGTSQDVPPSDSIMPSSSDEVVPQTQDSESSADAFDLDDVLEPSFLDLEPVTPERNTSTASAPATLSLWDPSASASSSSSILPPLPMPHNDLSRWDRIPVATFRRTRESAFTEYPGSDTSVGGNLVGTPMAHTLLKGRAKSSEKRSKGKGKRAQTLVISPVLLPQRDGDGVLSDVHFTPSRLPPHSHQSPSHHNQNSNQNNQQNQDNQHENKSRKERKENNAKRKAMGKYASRRFQQQQQQHNHHHQHHHHHGHFPNMKSRGTGSMQRTNFFAGSSSSVPHLSL